MKSIAIRTIAALILAGTAVCAMAQTSTTDSARDTANMHARNQYPIVNYQGSKTRAEVKAELVQAQRAGTITNGDDYPVLAQAVSHKTRAEVQRELVASRHQGAEPSLYSGY